MSLIYMIIGLCVGVGVLAFVVVKMRRPRPDSMGVMNDQWLAEQRLAHGPDPNR